MVFGSSTYATPQSTASAQTQRMQESYMQTENTAQLRSKAQISIPAEDQVCYESCDVTLGCPVPAYVLGGLNILT